MNSTNYQYTEMIVDPNYTTMIRGLPTDITIKPDKHTIIKNKNGVRSSVYNPDGKLICFSPMSSLKPTDYFYQNMANLEPGLLHDPIIVQEYVEGTMINIFFDQEWRFATKGNIGANNYFYINATNKKQSFKSMFLECLDSAKLTLNDFDINYSYSFVIQHVNNRIINPVQENLLYLISAYKIPDESYPESIQMIYRFPGMFVDSNLRFPATYEKELGFIHTILEKYASPSTPYSIMGVNLFNTQNGSRMKFRNPNYEELKKLRGNQAKMEYHYLELRKNGKVHEFLDFFPEHKKEFFMYESKILGFHKELHEFYISCYMKHEKPLRDFPHQYRTFMFKIHEQFQQIKVKTNGKIIMDYLNNLPEAVLMSALNYSYKRVQKNPDVVSDVSSEDNQNGTVSVTEEEKFGTKFWNVTYRRDSEDNHNDDVQSQTPSPPHSTPEETYIPKAISVDDISKALDEINHEPPLESSEEHVEHKKKKHHGGVKHGKGKHGRMHHQHQLEIEESGKEVE